VFRGVTHSTVFSADNSSLQPHILLLYDPSCYLSIYSRVSKVLLSLHLSRIKDDMHLSPLRSELHSSHVIFQHLVTLIIFPEQWSLWCFSLYNSRQASYAKQNSINLTCDFVIMSSLMLLPLPQAKIGYSLQSLIPIYSEIFDICLTVHHWYKWYKHQLDATITVY